MSLSLHATWLAAAQQANVRPRFLVTIWVASATSVKAISGKSDTMTYPASIQSVSPTNRSMNSWDRKLSTGAVTVTLRNDLFTDSLLNDYGLFGTRVEVELGFQDTAEANYAPYFTGIVTEVIPSPRGVVLKLKDVRDKIQNGATAGEWANTHPLSLIEDIALDTGVPTDMLDSTAFDPDTYNTSISHYVIDRSGTDINGERGIVEPENGASLIDGIAKILDGTVYVDESGILTFTRFDSSKALDDSWTIRDLIGDPPVVIESLYANLVNQVLVTSLPVGTRMVEVPGSMGLASVPVKYSARWREGDTDSQARFAYNNSSSATDAIVSRTITAPWLSAEAYTYFNNEAVNSTFVVRGLRSYAFCGTSWPGFPSGSQPTWSPLSATRTSYIQVEKEIIECKLSAVGTTQRREPVVQDPYEFDFEGAMTSPDTRPNIVTMTVGGRGQLGTSSVAHGTDRKIALDITLQVALARAKLERFVNGGPVIRCRTNLSKYAYQIGDFIGLTVSKEIYRSFGHAGLTDSVKWEIIGKNCDLNPNNPGIEWTLAYATESSPPSTTYTQTSGWFQKRRSAIERGRRSALESAEVADSTIASGFGFTDNGSLSVTIGQGTAANLLLRGELPEDYTFTVSASKDTWVTFDIENEAIVRREETSPSSEPLLDAGEVLLWKIVAGAASLTSVSDERTIQQSIPGGSIDTQAVTPAKLDYTTEIGSLMPNGELAIWSPPFDDQTLYPPDSWVTLTFDGGFTDEDDYWSSAVGNARVYFSTAYSRTSDTSTLIEVDGTSPGVRDKLGILSNTGAPVSEGQLYLLQFSYYADFTAAFRTVRRWYNKSGTWFSTGVANQTAVVGWNTLSFYIRAPANSVSLKLAAGVFTGGTGKVYIDYIRVVKAPASFFAVRLNSPNIAATTWTNMLCNDDSTTPAHDLGSDYDSTPGSGTQGDFTAPHDGYWSFSARTRVNSLPASDAFELALYHNGAPGVGTQVTSHYKYNSTGGAASFDLSVSTISMYLAAGDTVAAYVYWHDIPGAGGTIVSPGSTAGPNGVYTAYFAGQEKKEL